MPPKIEDKQSHFWKHVDIQDDKLCWEWTAGKSDTGYGMFHFDKLEGAHRISWKLTNGSIPKGKMVLHHCDNRKCCNPKHLFLVNHTDNALDMLSKGRHRIKPTYGEDNPCSKLTRDKVQQIREMASAGFTRKDIAEHFSISKSNVTWIVNGVTWK